MLKIKTLFIKQILVTLFFLSPVISTFSACEAEKVFLTFDWKQETGEAFGFSSAISGDYIFVGAPSAYSTKGAVYIYRKVNGGWQTHQELVIPDAGVGDAFGTTVAVEGSYAVMGCQYMKSGRGVAYVFKREANNQWVQQAKLEPSDNNKQLQKWYGSAVAISSNWLAVGAISDDEKDFWAGATYLYEKQNNSWVFRKKITSPEPQEEGFFGGAVALSDDLLAVGAYGQNIKVDGGVAPAAGTVYMYVRSGTEWNLEKQLVASDKKGVDHFGKAVALKNNRVIVGAPDKNFQENGKFTSGAGAAYVYRRRKIFNSILWLEEDKLSAFKPYQGAEFGDAVSINGDWAAVGCRDDSYAIYPQPFVYENAGSVFTFAYTKEYSWSPVAQIKGIDQQWGSANYRFGENVAMDGDNILVSAPLWGGDNTGAAFLFHKFCGARIPQ
ncbi:MAG: hypothetical protein R3F23_06520 [Verrucomicrobiia bacterium]